MNDFSYIDVRSRTNKGRNWIEESIGLCSGSVVCPRISWLPEKNWSPSHRADNWTGTDGHHSGWHHQV